MPPRGVAAHKGPIGLSILVRYHGHLGQHESCDRSFPQPIAPDPTAPVCAHDPTDLVMRALCIRTRTMTEHRFHLT